MSLPFAISPSFTGYSELENSHHCNLLFIHSEAVVCNSALGVRKFEELLVKHSGFALGSNSDEFD
jgi:hypothetical protein